jgi:MoaA/NifB/PqqE/SkfB family radical SAM enzyme
MEALALRLAEERGLARLLSGAASACPAWGKGLKYRNAALVAGDVAGQRPVCRGNPVSVRVAPIAVCNYRCLFCEIHKDDVLYPDRQHNILTMDHVRNYEGFLRTASRVAFYGGSAEPMLNRHFKDIAVYLKQRYGTELVVNTNGSCLNEAVSEALVQAGFDYILVSYHAGTPESYRHLMTGDVNRVNQGLEFLLRRRRELHRRKPVVDFNFALQKLNAGEYRAILTKAREIGIDCVHVGRYYGGRNRLQDQHVSFEFDLETGNRVLQEIYDYARELGVRLSPEQPQFWTPRPEGVDWNPDAIDGKTICRAPWTSLQFDPVLEEGDCHSVAVCNRIQLFKVRYTVARFANDAEFKRLWNHPLLQHLRDTVNAGKPNPICRYCKNVNRERLRNVDAEKYAAVRDQAVEDFFREFRARGACPDLPGVEVLSSNLESDARFRGTLKAAGLLT